MFRYVDALWLLPLYMYPKTDLACARHHIYFDPDSLCTYTNVRTLCLSICILNHAHTHTCTNIFIETFVHWLTDSLTYPLIYSIDQLIDQSPIAWFMEIRNHCSREWPMRLEIHATSRLHREIYPSSFNICVSRFYLYTVYRTIKLLHSRWVKWQRT